MELHHFPSLFSLRPLPVTLLEPPPCAPTLKLIASFLWLLLLHTYMDMYACVYININKHNLLSLFLCSMFLVIREMKIKNYSEMLSHPNQNGCRQESRCWQRCRESGIFIQCEWECKLIQLLWKSLSKIPPKCKSKYRMILGKFLK